MTFSYFIVLLTPIKGCCCVSPVTIIPGVKVQWRHFSDDAFSIIQFFKFVNVVVCSAGLDYQYVLHCYLSLGKALQCLRGKPPNTTPLEVLVFQCGAAFRNTRSPPWTAK